MKVTWGWGFDFWWHRNTALTAVSKILFPCSLLKPDRMEQQRMIGSAFSNLGTSLAAWNSLQHIQLLCNSYQQCQDRLWAGQDLEVQVPHSTPRCNPRRTSSILSTYLAKLVTQKLFNLDMGRSNRRRCIVK